jgi:hypothetical protein
MALQKSGDTVIFDNGLNPESAKVVVAVQLDSSGNPQTGLAPGRAPAAASVPVVLSSEDFARISQTYRRATAVGATAGDAVLVTGVTTAGTVSLTLANGGTAVISVPIGSTVLPFSATAAALGSAVGGTFQSLFFT